MRQSMPGHGRRHASHESVKYRCGSSLAHIWDWTCYKTRGNVSICKWSVGGKSQMWLWLEFRAYGGVCGGRGDDWRNVLSSSPAHILVRDS